MALRPLHLVLAVAALVLSLGARAEAMTFELISEPQACAERACILAAGEIDETTGPDFAAFLRTHPVARGGLVVLNSPGGDLLQSLVLGNKIRAAGLATTVVRYDRDRQLFRPGGVCASACAYAFLGGVERTVGQGARIGVHQIFLSDRSQAMTAADGLELMSLVAVHVNRLCGDLDLLIPAMKTRPQEMHWLTAVELTRYAVVTDATHVG